MSSLTERFAGVRERVAQAAIRAGRASDSVELIAVSKRFPAASIREAYALGQRHFGENYAQELRDKAEELKDLQGLRWHAIGPLQKNKAKYVARSAHAFHALDRLEIAAELSRLRLGGSLACFLEVNLADEASKSGVAPRDVEALAERVRGLPGLELVGLMCLPPWSEDPEASRPYFRQLSDLASRLGLSQLSMGSSVDFAVAIEEGATCVRIGTELFGDRPSRPA